jgi:hypothetical protein
MACGFAKHAIENSESTRQQNNEPVVFIPDSSLILHRI